MIVVSNELNSNCTLNDLIIYVLSESLTSNVQPVSVPYETFMCNYVLVYKVL